MFWHKLPGEQFPRATDPTTAQAPDRPRRVPIRRRVPLRGLFVAWLIAGVVGISAHPAQASDGSGSAAPACVAQSPVPSPYSQSVLAYAPLGYWHLGTACATDSSGNGLNGSFSGGVTTDPGAGSATSFDGASGYVTLGAPAPRFASRLSVEAWIKTTGNGSARQVIVSDRPHGYALYLDGGTGVPEFGIDNTTGTQWLTGGTSSVADGQWHYLVGTYDGYAVRLYVDGVPVSIQAAFSIDYLPTIGAIGRDGSNPAGYYKGSISDVAIYNTQLAPTQVKRHYYEARQTVTALTVGPSSTVYGQSYTAMVTVSGTGGTPSGTVMLYDGSSYVGAGTLDGSGAAVISIAPPVGNTTQAVFAPTQLGTQSFTAVYGGDSTFAGSTSAPVSHVVAPAPTITTLISSAKATSYGQPVTLTATVNVAAPGSGKITGMVIFMDGSTPLDVESLSSTNTATFSTSSLSTGTHSITAVYNSAPLTAGLVPPPSNFTNSVSAPLSLTVAKYITSFDVATNGPWVAGQPARILVAVGPASLGPTGVVTIKDGTTVLGTPAIQNGGASFQTQALAVGTHTLTISYAGDANYAGTSTTFTTSVGKAQTSSTLSCPANPATHGTTVTLTATVQVTTPGTGMASGTVTFMDGSTVLGTATLAANGTASFTTSALTVGSHVLRAVYGGSVSFAGSTSSPLSQEVK